MKLRHLAIGAAAAGLVAVSGPAFAAAPYTVAVNGSSAAGTHTVTATSTGTVEFSAKNDSGVVINMNCTGVTGSATVTSGPSVNNPIATINSTTWTSCVIPGGTAKVIQSGGWNINGTGTATAGLESVAGNVDNINVGVEHAALAAICNFDIVAGTANGSIDEVNDQLKINETGYTGNLTLANVNGCAGDLQDGNPANFKATLNLSDSINLS